MSKIKIGSLIQRISLFDDQQAFKELFWHYYDDLFYFSRSLVGSKEVAEEIVEDIFVNVWKKREEMGEIENLKVYLYVSVKNRSYNYLERNKNQYLQDINAVEESLLSHYPDPEDILFTAELKKVFDEAIINLPPQCQRVYKLVKLDGLRYKEVATILDISPRTVENHVAKALKKIASKVKVYLSASFFMDTDSSK